MTAGFVVSALTLRALEIGPLGTVAQVDLGVLLWVAVLLFGGAASLALWRVTGRARELAESELRLRDALAERTGSSVATILESITDQFYALDHEWRFTYLNERAEAFIGRSREELLGRCLWEEFPATVEERVYVEYHAAVRDQQSRVFEAPSRIAPGRWLEVRAYPSADGLSVYCRDVTERHSAEHQLRATREHLQVLVESAPLAIITLDRAGSVLMWNRAAERMFGWTAEEVIGRPYPIVPSGRRAEHQRILDDGFLHDRPARGIETRRLRKDGTEIDVQFWSAVVGAGEDALSVGLVTEITDRKKGEAALRNNERLLATAEQIARFGSWEWRIADGSVSWSPQSFHVHGVEPTVEPSFRLFSDLLHPDDRDDVLSVVKRAFDEHDGFDHEYRIIRPDGVERLLHGRGEYMPGADGTGRFVGTVRDVTDDRSAEDRLQYVTATSPAVLYTMQVDGEGAHPTWISDNVHQLLGYTPGEALTATWWWDNLHPDHRQDALAAMQRLFRTDSLSHEYRFRTRDGRYRWIRDQLKLVRDRLGRPVEIVGSWIDASDFRDLEAQLQQARKMEAIGRLAGGIAHDFNNLLTAVQGYAGLMLEDLDPSSPLRSDAADIIEAGERGADLVRQLLAFSRQQVIRPEVLDPNQVVSGMLKMLERLIGEDVALTTQLAPSIGCVRADNGQLEQVLLNLAVNARDAMPDGGELSISTRSVNLAGEPRLRRLDAPDVTYVRLDISDTGIGIEPGDLERIFEPFFTRKEQGKGTGLGLATVYGIIKQSGGYVLVASQLGVGTTFRVYLPEVDAVAAPRAQNPRPTPARDASGIVLLAEDQAGVRRLARRTLERHGYTVLEAGDGIEALAIVLRDDVHIDLLLTDVIMPGMGGQDLAEQVQRKRPGLPVVFMSGYAEDRIVHHGELASDTHYIGKPFRPADLVAVVADAMEPLTTQVA